MEGQGSVGGLSLLIVPANLYVHPHSDTSP